MRTQISCSDDEYVSDIPMPCYSPLHAFKGKSEDASKIKIVWRRPDSFRGERIDLPCGQCIGCRLERSRQWAVRCMHEASLWPENSFITLTYSDESLPSDGSVHLEHFQCFMKRLRRRYAPKKIRFFHCGEYGEKFSRPHYHALLFNHDWADKQLFSGRDGNQVYTSAEMSSLWPYGFSVSGEVTFESAAYVARYVMKKVTGEKAVGHYGDRRPEYITMSRRPGIGKGWFDKFASDVYPRDRVFVRGSFSRPPRFYDGLLGRVDPAGLGLIKINRELKAERFVKDVLSDGRVIKESDNSGRRLLVREEVKKAEISTLRRPLEEL